MKTIKFLAMMAVLITVAIKGPQMAKIAKGQAEQIQQTQAACAAHTAAVNEVLDYLK